MRIITEDGLERLLLANPIAALAAELGIVLAPLGARLLVGRCPLHAPPVGRSLLVDVQSGRFRCLVCSPRGGNALGLVMQLEALPFLAAVEWLAARAGLHLDELMDEPAPRLAPESRLLDTVSSSPPIRLTTLRLQSVFYRMAPGALDRALHYGAVPKVEAIPPRGRRP